MGEISDEFLGDLMMRRGRNWLMLGKIASSGLVMAEPEPDGIPCFKAGEVAFSILVTNSRGGKLITKWFTDRKPRDVMIAVRGSTHVIEDAEPILFERSPVADGHLDRIVIG